MKKNVLFFLIIELFYCFDVQAQIDAFAENIHDLSFKMVKVEGGTFQIGSKDSKPTNTITLTDFYIAETEVTQALWQKVMGSNPSEFKGCDECPVENVSWDDVVNEFLPKIQQLTGKKYTLPTEAQWEYAARGGKYSIGYTFAGSNSLDGVAWYENNSQLKTNPVKTKAPNELGLYDMSGNVWEWCLDWYSEEFYKSAEASQKNPVNNKTGNYRVLRGGSWYGLASYCGVADRFDGPPTLRDHYIGFRLTLQE